MAQKFLNKRTFSFVLAGLLFLGSLWYLVSVAFDTKQAFSASSADIGAVFDAVIHTTAGDFVLQFYPDRAPQTKRNFVMLAKTGFYNDTKFHRVIPDVLIQGGDPYTKRDDVSRYGTGDPGYTIKDEINDTPMKRGVVGMAHRGPGTAGSQFFVLAGDRPDLEGKFTAFAFVSQGLDVIDAISRVDRVSGTERPRTPITITSITLRQ